MINANYDALAEWLRDNGFTATATEGVYERRHEECDAYLLVTDRIKISRDIIPRAYVEKININITIGDK